MARLRRFLMLEKPRDGDPAPGARGLDGRFGELGAPPAPDPPPDPFAPPPEPQVLLEVALPPAAEPVRDEALAAEIAAIAGERERVGVAPVRPSFPRPIDRLAALLAVGPLAAWSPAARRRLVVGLWLLALAGLLAFGGIGPRLLQGALLLLLFALFLRS